jgi:hypothetical protein
MCERERGIDRQRFGEGLHGALRVSLHVAAVEQGPPLRIGLERAGIECRRLGEPAARGGRQGDRERARDGERKPLLHREDLGGRSVEILRPDDRPVRTCKDGGKADAPLGPLDAAADDVRGAELTRDALQIGAFFDEALRGGARDNGDTGEGRKL